MTATMDVLSLRGEGLPTGLPTPRRRPLPALGWAGLLILVVFAVLALAAPVLSPHRPAALTGDPLERPSGHHLLGTNSVGQDVATQLLWGARVSLLVAVVAGGGTLLVGGMVGGLAGWWGGTAEAVIMRAVDFVQVIPKLPLLIVVGAYTSASVLTVAAIIALTFWPGTARVVRAQVFSLRRRTHLRAAVGFGAASLHVLRRHVAPELGLILLVSLVADTGRAVLLQAGLAFLGIGDPTTVSWGSVLRDALNFRSLFYTDAWAWWLLPPIAAISLLLLGVTFLGTALEPLINPRLARHVGGASLR